MQFVQWCAKEFQLPLNVSLFQAITGPQLCSFTAQQFQTLAKEHGPTLHAFIQRIKTSATCKAFHIFCYIICF